MPSRGRTTSGDAAGWPRSCRLGMSATLGQGSPPPFHAATSPRPNACPPILTSSSLSTSAFCAHRTASSWAPRTRGSRRWTGRWSALRALTSRSQGRRGYLGRFLGGCGRHAAPVRAAQPGPVRPEPSRLRSRRGGYHGLASHADVLRHGHNLRVAPTTPPRSAWPTPSRSCPVSQPRTAKMGLELQRLPREFNPGSCQREEAKHTNGPL